MTIEILFLEGNKPVAKVNMTVHSLYSKILTDVSDENFEESIEECFDNTTGAVTVTDKECIVKVWNSCIRHGYISENFDMLVIFIDKMKIDL